LWWDHKDNNKKQQQQQQQLENLLRNVFYNFELSCIFIINLLVFGGGGLCKSAAARGERQQLEIVNVVENLLEDLRERERERERERARRA